jgi:hypothetical protein
MGLTLRVFGVSSGKNKGLVRQEQSGTGGT